MSKYKLKQSAQVNIDIDMDYVEEKGLSFGDIVNDLFINFIKEFEKPFIDKILELGYTLEQLKSGELNDVFSMHLREYEVKGERWEQHCLMYKGKVIAESFPKIRSIYYPVNLELAEVLVDYLKELENDS